MEEVRETFRLMLPRIDWQGRWETRWYGWRLSGGFPGNPREARNVGEIRRRSR